MPFVSGETLLRLIERADDALSKLENAAYRRVDRALLLAYNQLEAELRVLYNRARIETANDGLAMREARARVLLNQLQAILDLTKNANAQAIFSDLVKEAYANGLDAGLEILTRYRGDVATLNTGIPIEVIAQASNASERLKQHGQSFAVAAEQAIINGLVRGEGFNKMAKGIREATGATRNKALVIARTEVINASDTARRDSYMNFDIELVIRIATQDLRICGYCASRAGLVYARDLAPAALHPNDRCYNAPFSSEWLKQGLIDVDWYKKHRTAAIAKALESGQVLRRGAAPFEKLNGLEPPQALWSPESGWL